MKKNDVQDLINTLTPKLYSFAYAMLPDELKAEQMVIDAYAIFLVREKAFIQGFKYTGEKKEKSAMKKFIMSHVLSDIYHLGKKRSFQLKNALLKNEQGLYESFYHLNSNLRATLFLKEILKYPTEGIQEILGLKKYQVIEALYNARHMLLEQGDSLNGSGVHQNV